MRATHWGKGVIGLQAAVPKRPHTRPLTFNFVPRHLLKLCLSLLAQIFCIKCKYASLCFLLKTVKYCNMLEKIAGNFLEVNWTLNTFLSTICMCHGNMEAIFETPEAR